MLEDKFIKFISPYINYSIKRQEYLSDNIANINTPGYKRKDLIFIKNKENINTHLNLKTTRNRHITEKIEVNRFYKEKVDKLTSLRTDANNVDLEREMALITRNSFYYQSLLSFARFRFSMLKKAIEGR